jgi:hypothetical protein
MRRIGFDRVKLRFGRPSPEWCYVRGDETQRGKRINVSGSLVAEVGGDKAKREASEEAEIPF